MPRGLSAARVLRYDPQKGFEASAVLGLTPRATSYEHGRQERATDERGDHGSGDVSRPARRDDGQYDQLNEQMGTTQPENEPEGLVFHVCAKTATGGLLICDVWRSQEEVDDFLANMLGPAAATLGLPPGDPPRFGEVHYQVKPR